MFKIVDIDYTSNNFIVSYNDNADPIEIKIPRGVHPQSDDFNIESVKEYINSLLPSTSNSILTDTVYNIVAESDILKHYSFLQDLLEDNKIRLTTSPYVTKDITVNINTPVFANTHLVSEKAEIFKIPVAESYSSIDAIKSSNNNVFLTIHSNLNQKYLHSKDEIIELLSSVNDNKIFKDYSYNSNGSLQWTETTLNIVIGARGDVIVTNWIEASFKEEKYDVRFNDGYYSPGIAFFNKNDEFFIKKVVNSTGSNKITDNTSLCEFFNEKLKSFISSFMLHSTTISIRLIKYQDNYYLTEIFNEIDLYANYVDRNLLVNVLFDKSKDIQNIISGDFNTIAVNIFYDARLNGYNYLGEQEHAICSTDQYNSVEAYMNTNSIVSSKPGDNSIYYITADNYDECNRKKYNFEVFLEEN